MKDHWFFFAIWAIIYMPKNKKKNKKQSYERKSDVIWTWHKNLLIQLRENINQLMHIK